MNAPAKVGHNNPPDPIDEINAEFEAIRMEAENWLDGSPVENEAQMKAVDDLRKGAREWRLSLERGQKSATAPLYDAYKTEGARWKPTIDDVKRVENGLVSAVAPFKKRIADEKAEVEKRARAEAEAKMREAREAANRANAADIEAQREIATKQAEAEEAAKAARAAKNDKIGGLRTVTKYEITDPKLLLNWLAKNRRDDVMAFLADWARRNHKQDPGADGLNVWTEKEAY